MKDRKTRKEYDVLHSYIPKFDQDTAQGSKQTISQNQHRKRVREIKLANLRINRAKREARLAEAKKQVAKYEKEIQVLKREAKNLDDAQNRRPARKTQTAFSERDRMTEEARRQRTHDRRTENETKTQKETETLIVWKRIVQNHLEEMETLSKAIMELGREIHKEGLEEIAATKKRKAAEEAAQEAKKEAVLKAQQDRLAARLRKEREEKLAKREAKSRKVEADLNRLHKIEDSIRQRQIDKEDESEERRERILAPPKLTVVEQLEDLSPSEAYTHDSDLESDNSESEEAGIAEAETSDAGVIEAKPAEAEIAEEVDEVLLCSHKDGRRRLKRGHDCEECSTWTRICTICFECELILCIDCCLRRDG